MQNKNMGPLAEKYSKFPDNNRALNQVQSPRSMGPRVTARSHTHRASEMGKACPYHHHGSSLGLTMTG